MSINKRGDPNERLKDATLAWLEAMLVPPPGRAEIAPEPASPPAVIPRRRRLAEMAERSRRFFSRLAERLQLRPREVIVEARPAGRNELAARQARWELEAALAADPAPRFTRFCETFDLSPFERDILLLCHAHARHSKVAGWCAKIPESVNGTPTFALSLFLAEDPAWDSRPADLPQDTPRLAAALDWAALAPDRPLRRWQLIEITQPGGQALISSPLRLDERIVNHLEGWDEIDDRLASVTAPVTTDVPGGVVGNTQRPRLAPAIDRLASLADLRSRQLVQLPGTDTATKRLFAQHIAHAFGRTLHQVHIDQLTPATLNDFVTLWNREQRLQPVALLIEAMDAGAEQAPALRRLLSGLTGLVFLDVPEALGDQETAVVLDPVRPEPAEQRAIWEGVLADESGDWPDRLASQFSLNPEDLTDALAIVHDEAIPPDAIGPRVWSLYRARARPRLEGLAQRIDTGTRLADVQLPDNECRLLGQIRDQARNRLRVYDDFGFRTRLSQGLGISALFAGESGTGKTMAAEALANELELDLYRIDLASVVSKYIGETEKNLRRIFDAAGQSGAVLLFDEADAIFGKRSEVQDSHDRYANIEVSYLLQRMEAYEGLAILTTNMKQALDPAFLRRLRFTVTFPFPGEPERERIWRGVFPHAPTDDPGRVDYLVPGANSLDFRELARPSLTGGQIRNVALNAAFLAAAAPEGERFVTMELLRDAARDELRKGGKTFPAADYAGWTTPATNDPGALAAGTRSAAVEATP